jgi:hypothetical protein
MIPKERFEELVVKQKSDRGYRSFFTWEQLVVMLFGIFSCCDSMGEVCDGMRALEGKLSYLGMDYSPAKSTAGDALRDRDNEFFRLFYFTLLIYFRPLMSVSRKKKEVSFEEFYAFDSTAIRLFSEIMKGVGRSPKDDGKKKRSWKKGGFGVYKVEHIHLKYREEKKEKTLCLRFVYYKDEKGENTNLLPITGKYRQKKSR